MTMKVLLAYLPRERYPNAAPPPDEVPEAKKLALYEGYLGSEAYNRLKRGIVHVESGGHYGSIYLANRITAATGLRTDSGGWAPEVRSPLMLREVELARQCCDGCAWVFRKKAEAFTAEEVSEIMGRHDLDWSRQLGRYLVGGFGDFEPGDVF